MTAFGQPRDDSSPTGRLSQQAQPSTRREPSFMGGYLVPSGRLGPQPVNSTAGSDNANISSRLTGADDPRALSQRIVAPVIPLPRRIERAHLRAIQSWEGVVDTIEHDSFVAQLHDRQRRGRPEEAGFPFSDVADGDLGLVVEGAVFYWTIGYLIAAGGQRTRTSTIRFRRLPVWTEQELSDAEARATQTAHALEWL